MTNSLGITCIALALAATSACGSHASGSREAWAVGSDIGGGSFLFGSSDCTYDAPPSVAELARNREGKVFMAKLVGPGTITETCGSKKQTIDVVVPTSLRIDGPSVVKMKSGEPGDHFSVQLLAGKRELSGVHQGGTAPDWSLGQDCAGVAAFGDVLGSQDTGGADITRTLVPAKPGTCTISASIFGLSGTRSVTIQ